MHIDPLALARFRDAETHQLTAGAVVAVAGYGISYASSHLPLYQIIEPGRYPILSLAHLGNLANVALLISPFGLIWGIVFYRRATWMPPTAAATCACSATPWPI